MIYSQMISVNSRQIMCLEFSLIFLTKYDFAELKAETDFRFYGLSVSPHTHMHTYIHTYKTVY